MKNKSHMPIREFSRLTGIKRENLRYYDQIGLLSPELRGENGYRYYAWEQLDTAFLISDLRMLDVSIEKIKQYADERSPEGMLALFKEQKAHVQSEINRLHTLQDLMQMRIDMVDQAMAHSENALFIQKKDGEPIFVCPVFKNCTEKDAIIKAYDFAAEHKVNLSSPFGVSLVANSFKKSGLPSAFCCYFKTNQNSNSWKPSGTYAVVYGRCNYLEADEVYARLIDFIQKKGLKIGGDVYEEYPLDSLSMREGELYGVRIEVRVTR